MPPPRSSRPPPSHRPHPHGPPHHGAPPHGPPHHGPPPHAPHPATRSPIPSPRRSPVGLSSLVRADELADALAPFVSDEEDRAFVARCIATEGPSHHRIASSALLRLLAEALRAAGGAPGTGRDDDLPVAFRLPPHLDRHADEDAHYPLRLSRRAIERLAPAGSREAETIADSLADGPAHHALANVAMVNLLDALIERLSGRESA